MKFNSWFLFLFSFVFICWVYISVLAEDPCTSFEWLHKSEYRGENCKYSLNGICDDYIHAAWYRIKGDAPMLTFSPGTKQCATEYTVWLNGSLPTIQEDIVNRNACMTGYSSSCVRTLPIQIKNCTSYYVYYLDKTMACDAAYCFGPGLECPPYDPCDFYYHLTMPDTVFRTLRCRPPLSDSRCDSTLSEYWYKLPNGQHLTNTVPENKVCGKENPIWINGTLPLGIAETTNQTACVYTSSSYCDNSFTVRIKNCSEYLVYFLKGTSQCSERYCIGNGENLNCPTTSVPPTLGTTTETSGGNTSGIECIKNCGIKPEIILLIIITVFAVVSSVAVFVVILKKQICRVKCSPMDEPDEVILYNAKRI